MKKSWRKEKLGFSLLKKCPIMSLITLALASRPKSVIFYVAESYGGVSTLKYNVTAGKTLSCRLVFICLQNG